MGFRKLREQSKIAREKQQKQFFKYLIVGDDFASIATYQHLMENKDEGEVKILSTFQIDFAKTFFPGPSDLRGDDNISAVKKLRSDLEISVKSESSKFFKELKFRKFGGRSKSEPLLPGEEYYVQQGCAYSVNDFIPTSQEKRDQLLSNNIECLVGSICKTIPDNLLEKHHWVVECEDGKRYACEYLFFGRSPAEFLKLSGDKDSLTNDFHSFCANTYSRHGMFVNYDFGSLELDRENGTFFLPQSLTHEWGHFIGEFHGNHLRLFSFIGDEETSEIVSKKVRLLKRVLEKAFPIFKNKKIAEKIIVSDLIPMHQIDDELFDRLLIESKEQVENLFLLGPNAPISKSFWEESGFDQSRQKITHFARALVSFHQARRLL